jgi:DNA-binding transcriptional ArsR family regulator
MKEKYYIMRSGVKDEIAPAKILERPGILNAVANPLGFRIFQMLSSPRCPMDIARKLGEHEQKIYYHINKFRRRGLVEEVRSEKRKGTIAKFYQAKDNAFVVKLGDSGWERLDRPFQERKRSMEPFVVRGRPDFIIVVGSPDPHGPWKERALDSPTAIDLALFIGTFISEMVAPNYKLDIEMRENDLRKNLILVGGPLVNMITRKINKSLPVNFDLANKNIVSRISNNVYRDDQFGSINLVENPWNRAKKILVFAGKRFPGTRAAILAFMNDPEKILRGNRFDKSKVSRVVRGYDIGGDGIIDSAEIME